MSKPPNPICIRAGRIFCPASGFDGPATLTIQGDQILSVAACGGGSDVLNSDPRAACDFDFPDSILLPGLIDLHAHPAKHGSVFGVDPDQFMLARGVTTVVSQGDAGALGIDDFVATTSRDSQARILLAINLSRIGESTTAGCFEALEDADVDACVAAVNKHRAHVCAVAVNASHHACGRTDPREVLARGIEAVSQVKLPLLYGLRRPEDWPLQDQLRSLRPGDIVTYCFRREPHCIIECGRVLPCVREARERGLLFDVGHGMASFDFDIAEAAIRDGFLPHTISTDFQKRHIGQRPPHHLPRVMSKLHAAGMPESAILAAVTKTPSRILQLGAQVGTLEPGACADLVVVDVEDDHVLTDVYGQQRRAAAWVPRLIVRAGRIVEPEDCV